MSALVSGLTADDFKKVFLSRVPLKLTESKVAAAAAARFGEVVSSVSLVAVDDSEIDVGVGDVEVPKTESVKAVPHKGYGYLTFNTVEEKERALKFGAFDANPKAKRKHNIIMREIERNQKVKFSNQYNDGEDLSAYSGGEHGGKNGVDTEEKNANKKVPPATENRMICYLWQSFRCPHHEQCKFSHVGPGGCVAKKGEGKKKKCLEVSRSYCRAIVSSSELR